MDNSLLNDKKEMIMRADPVANLIKGLLNWNFLELIVNIDDLRKNRLTNISGAVGPSSCVV